jgi:hypothetical protein
VKYLGRIGTRSTRWLTIDFEERGMREFVFALVAGKTSLMIIVICITYVTSGNIAGTFVADQGFSFGNCHRRILLQAGFAIGIATLIVEIARQFRRTVGTTETFWVVLLSQCRRFLELDSQSTFGTNRSIYAMRMQHSSISLEIFSRNRQTTFCTSESGLCTIFAQSSSIGFEKIAS